MHFLVTHSSSKFSFRFQEGNIGTDTIYRKRELNQTIQRLKSSNAEMLTMYRIVRAQYVFPSSLMSPRSDTSEGSTDTGREVRCSYDENRTSYI
jgi:hypothetical protein